MRILVTGASGYIGGRLIPRLLDRGHSVRALVRSAGSLGGRPWAERVEVVEADLMEPDSLPPATDGMDAAAYLVHSMGSGPGFADKDRRAAENFAAAAGERLRVVYLGGIQPTGGDESLPTSEHLESREQVGEVLRERLHCIELRAGPIIGSGSMSFEMVRYLSERLPIMLLPRWSDNPVRPVGVRDVLAYLVAALEADAEGVVDIGAEPLSFQAMLAQYAEVRGLRRRFIHLPLLIPRIAALWVGLVTPVSNKVARPLMRGMIRPVVGDVGRAAELFPQVRPESYREAVKRAIELTESGAVETRWTGGGEEAETFELRDWEGTKKEERSALVQASPETVYRTVASLGGENGWLVWGWAWSLRGWIDQIVGGPGLRRGRRDAEELWEGEAVDFWRVERAEPPRLLRLRAEMRLPGRAWLQWEICEEDGASRLVQTALFVPKGLWGLVYWYLVYPAHGPIFSGMVKELAGRAEQREQAGRVP